MNSREFGRHFRWLRLGRWLLAAALLLLGAEGAQAAEDIICGDRVLPVTQLSNDLPDLKVTGNCQAAIGYTTYYKNINILKGGKLSFHEGYETFGKKETHLWANSIIIENGGAMIADGGVGQENSGLPYGYAHGGTLTIHLYGQNDAVWNRDTQKFTAENKGVPCRTDETTTVGPCGIPILAADGKTKVWENNGKDLLDLPGRDAGGKPVNDYFYQYGPLYGDGRCVEKADPKKDKGVFFKGACRDPAGNEFKDAKVSGYFGNKVLAVSYGGTLDLAGYKGAVYDAEDGNPLSSGVSWVRLADGHSRGKGRGPTHARLVAAHLGHK